MYNFTFKHNTEFTPKLCTTCKCKNGVIECGESCVDDEEQLYDEETGSADLNNIIETNQLTSLNQRKERLRQHHRNLKTRTNQETPIDDTDDRKTSEPQGDLMVKSICYHDNRIHPFNTTWSPLRCTQCKCNFNSIVDCFVIECPVLNCTNVSIIFFAN